MLYFIVNKTARTGNGYTIWPTIKTALQDRAVPYKAYLTEYAGHAKELAYKISSFEETSIFLVVLGGDGTINEVVNGIVDFNKIHLGIIPTGSGNDFVRGVGLTKDVKKSIQLIIDYYENSASNPTDVKEFFIDLGQARWELDAKEYQRYFVISSGLGMDAIVCKKAFSSRLKKVLNQFHLGKLTYLLLTIHSLFTMQTSSCEVVFDSNTYSSKYQRVVFSSAMNLRAEGGGIPMAPNALCTDHQLTMCIAHSLFKGTAFFLLPLLVLGKHTSLKYFSLQTFNECSLTFTEPTTLHLDGEYGGEVEKISFSCYPNQLRLIDTR